MGLACATLESYFWPISTRVLPPAAPANRPTAVAPHQASKQVKLETCPARQCTDHSNCMRQSLSASQAGGQLHLPALSQQSAPSQRKHDGAQKRDTPRASSSGDQRGEHCWAPQNISYVGHFPKTGRCNRPT